MSPFISISSLSWCRVGSQSTMTRRPYILLINLPNPPPVRHYQLWKFIYSSRKTWPTTSIVENRVTRQKTRKSKHINAIISDGAMTIVIRLTLYPPTQSVRPQDPLIHQRDIPSRLSPSTNTTHQQTILPHLPLLERVPSRCVESVRRHAS